MTYKNLRVNQLSNGMWLAEVNILSPKSFNLQFADPDKDKAIGEIVKYLEYNNAEDRTQKLLGDGR